MAEWAYRTPTYPEGLTSSALRRKPEVEQAELAEYWFRLNFVPLEIEVGGAGYGTPAAGPGGYAPSNAMAISHLNDEFAEVLPSEVIVALSHCLHSEASWWEPIPPEGSPSDISDPAALACVALERVEADLDRIGLGHNQGPPLDSAVVAEIRKQVRLGLDAVESASAGSDAGKSAASALLTLAGTVGSAFTQGVAKKAGEDAEPLIKHGLAVLLDHILQAASALLHWIASIPPGPFL